MTPGQDIAQRLATHMPISVEERDFLHDWQEEVRPLPAGRSIVARGGPPGALHVLVDGWAVVRSETVRGRAAILRVYLPGDLIGLCSLAMRRAPHEVRMQTAGAIRTLPSEGVRALLRDQPRLGSALLALCGHDQLILRDHCMALSLMTAEDRLLHFFLELHARLAAGDPASQNRIFLPFSQAEIGAAVGMTSVYVNKLLRKLSEEGRIEVERPYLHLLDRAGMEAQTGFVDRFRMIDRRWFPKPTAEVA